ncbi:hypothetical protein D3C80_1974950 [compost metagenome]
MISPRVKMNIATHQLTTLSARLKPIRPRMNRPVPTMIHWRKCSRLRKRPIWYCSAMTLMALQASRAAMISMVCWASLVTNRYCDR